MLKSFWVHDMSYNATFEMTYRCLYYSRYGLKQFCHENMIKTLISPHYSAFDLTAVSIRQLLVYSDIHAQSSHKLTICSSELPFLVLGLLFFEGGYILLYCGTPTFWQRGLWDSCFQNPSESSDAGTIGQQQK